MRRPAVTAALVTAALGAAPAGAGPVAAGPRADLSAAILVSGADGARWELAFHATVFGAPSPQVDTTELVVTLSRCPVAQRCAYHSHYVKALTRREIEIAGDLDDAWLRTTFAGLALDVGLAATAVQDEYTDSVLTFAPPEEDARTARAGVYSSHRDVAGPVRYGRVTCRARAGAWIAHELGSAAVFLPPDATGPIAERPARAEPARLPADLAGPGNRISRCA